MRSEIIRRNQRGYLVPDEGRHWTSSEAIRSQSDGNQMAIRWPSDGKQMASRWQADGKQMASRWPSDGDQGTFCTRVSTTFAQKELDDRFGLRP